MPSATLLLLAALVLSLALTHAHPTSDAHGRTLNTAAVTPAEPEARIKKRSANQATTDEEIAALKQLLLESVAAQMVGELPAALSRGQEGVGQEEVGQEESKRKRMYAPLPGLPGELPTIKRQIRYHQCYFNPISCFRRK